MSDSRILEACGGKKISTGELGGGWWFGYDPPGARSSAQEAAEALVPIEAHDPMEDVPEIKGDKVFLWEFLAAANGGECPPMNWQVTGSCVKGGAENMSMVRTGIESVCLPSGEKFYISSTFPAYAEARERTGQTSPGEGASASLMGEALNGLGTIPIDDPELPTPKKVGPAYVYTKAEELRFSSIRNISAGLKERCSKHRFGKLIRIRSADEGETELRRGRPMTWAGDWGGSMQMSYAGEPRVLFQARRTDTWNHQESVHAVWRHPSLGRIFRVQNQWFIMQNGIAVPVHGGPTLPGEPPGGFWIPEREFEYQCRSGEVFAFAGFAGLPEDFLRFSRV